MSRNDTRPFLLVVPLLGPLCDILPTHESSYERDSPFFTHTLQTFVENDVELQSIDLGVSDFNAGLVPLPSNFKGSRQLIFCFFPPTSPSGMDEVVNWGEKGSQSRSYYN